MRKQFVEILGKVVEQKRHYRNRVMLSHNLYELYFDTLTDFPDMPSHIADQLAVNRFVCWHTFHILLIHHWQASPLPYLIFSILPRPNPLTPRPPHPSSNPKKGPWRVTLNSAHCEPYMAYCSDRTKRQELWNALNNRSSIKHDEKNLSNHLIIKVYIIYYFVYCGYIILYIAEYFISDYI